MATVHSSTACNDAKSSSSSCYWFQRQKPRDFLSKAKYVGSTLLAAATLVFTVITPTDIAMASDETLLFDLSKEDSKIIEGRTPPEIKSSSSERAMALSKKMKKLNSKMYGAYWCKFCAKQKEAFGKEAFESKNVDYIECSEEGKNTQATTLCKEKKIQGFPTWEIGGKLFSGERSLEEIEVLVRMTEASPPGQNFAPPMIVTSSSERAMTIANQLKDLNANLFGAYWDPHTFEAKERLGAGAMMKIPYIECGKDGDNSQLDFCKERGVKVVPTWSVAGKLYPGDLDFEELDEVIANTKALPETTTLQSSSSTGAEASAGPKVEKAPAVEKVVPTNAKSKPAPPPITTASTEKTLTLAQQMEGNARMYGAYFCTHCKDQKDLFGKEAFEKIQYIECTQDGKDSQLAMCLEKGINSVPTWEINGKLFVGQRSIDQLQELVAAELVQQQQSTSVTEAPTEGIAPPPIFAESSDRALKLASSLESLNAKVYGAYWCRFTQSQKEKFGSEAFKKIQYVECSKDGLNSASGVCREKGVVGYPMWEISGKMYPGDQELEELEDIVKESQMQ